MSVTRSRGAIAAAVGAAIALVASCGTYGEEATGEGAPPNDDASAVESASNDGSAAVAVATTAECAAKNGTCEPNAPNGWRGPYAVGQAAGTSAPSCANGFPDEIAVAHLDLVAAPAKCSKCTCGEPSGVGCGRGSIRGWSGATCGSGCSAAARDLNTGSCTGLGGTCNGMYANAIDLIAAPTVGGSCVPSVAEAAFPALSWGTSVRACAPAAEAISGCGERAACVPPRDPSVFVCVVRDGDFPCPEGVYATRHVFYQSADDGRSCSACTCAGAAGGTCTTTLSYHDVADFNCTNAALGSGNAPTCFAFPSGPAANGKINVSAPTGASCKPLGGDPTGDAKPAQPITVCCAS